MTGSLYADPNGWQTDRAITQPWRVTMVARDLTALVNSTLIQNLNPPATPALAAASWIRPGRSSWQWLAIGAPKGKRSTPMGRLDQTARIRILSGRRRMGRLEDAVGNAGRHGELREMARSATWVWVHSKETFDATARRALLKRYAAMGIVGVKVELPTRPTASGTIGMRISPATPPRSG
ncbi:glycoside hydrolase family 97 N-terminal domain-containing protein [Sphingomonas sp. MMS24-JH45]